DLHRRGRRGRGASDRRAPIGDSVSPCPPCPLWWRGSYLKYHEVIQRLEAALRGPLPGSDAQARMAPRPRRQWPADFNPARIRHAAGLLLVYPIDDRAYVVLTLRAESLRHGGQVSLPGGVTEPGETFAQAALREAHEEVALDEPVRVLGMLTPLDIP